MALKEKHGLEGIQKAKNTTVSDDTLVVLVSDGAEKVLLGMSGAPVRAAMTPDEARFIAEQLILSATRVEKEIASS